MEIKQVRCKQCRKKITPKYNGTNQFCDVDCYLVWLKTPAGQKQYKIVGRKLEKESKSEMKEAIKTPSDYKEDLQKEINTIVRLIDRECPCISSGQKFFTPNAGHYVSVAAAGNIRYNLFNIYVQSVNANKWRSGDLLNYKLGLVAVFGQEHFEYVESLKLKYKDVTFDVITLKEKIKIAREIVRELKKADLTYSTLERLELRETYNNQIGIYL